MLSMGRIVGCRVSTQDTMVENQKDVIEIEKSLFRNAGSIGQLGWDLFSSCSEKGCGVVIDSILPY